MQRRFKDGVPQISFTSDFHELLEGDLRPGISLTLRYDPDRLSPPPEYAFGDPQWPVFAQLRFLDQGPVTTLRLKGPVTPLPDRDPTGQGSMLKATTAVPADAQFVEVWFYGEMPNGRRWDSEYGANFWFGFPYQDLRTVSAIVTPRAHQDARFQLNVSSIPAVQAVSVRFYDMSSRIRVKREEHLRLGGPLSHSQEWTFETAVAPAAFIRFKLYYWIAGRRFKDDNSGQYYVADRPDVQEHIPPPPPALVSAARDWKQKLGSPVMKP